VKVELIFQTSAQKQSRFMPVWQITLKERTVYVTQQERVFDTLTPMLPGVDNNPWIACCRRHNTPHGKLEDVIT